jgi:hypothetical protein
MTVPLGKRGKNKSERPLQVASKDLPKLLSLPPIAVFFMTDDEKQFLKAISFFRKYRTHADRDLYLKMLMTFCDRLEKYLNRNSDIKQTDQFAAEVQAAIF